MLGAKARAMLQGRAFASTDDVRAVAAPVLRHRIVTNFNAEADGVTADVKSSVDSPNKSASTSPRSQHRRDACGLPRILNDYVSSSDDWIPFSLSPGWLGSGGRALTFADNWGSLLDPSH